MLWRLIIPALVLTPLALVAPAVGEGECVPECAVDVRSPGGFSVFVAPVLTIRSGGSIAFSTSDNLYHTASSGPSFNKPCLDVQIWSGATVEAKFVIDGDVLTVLMPPDTPGDEPDRRTCTAADGIQGDSEVGFTLAYRCNEHGDSQRGVIVVLPAEA